MAEKSEKTTCYRSGGLAELLEIVLSWPKHGGGGATLFFPARNTFRCGWYKVEQPPHEVTPDQVFKWEQSRSTKCGPEKNRVPKALRSPAVGTCCYKYKALPASSQKSRAKDPTILQGAFPFLLSPAMIKDRPPTEKLTPDKVPKLRGTTRASNEKLTQRSGKHIFSSISKIQQTSKNSQCTHVLFSILPRKAKKNVKGKRQNGMQFQKNSFSTTIILTASSDGLNFRDRLN